MKKGVLVTFFLLFLITPALATEYSITDIYSSVPHDLRLTGINDAGTIVGWGGSGDGNGFIWNGVP